MRRRPWGIWVVIVLQIALAITLLPWFAESLPAFTPADNVQFGREPYVVWALLNVAAAVWLWTLSRRGWVLTMVLVGIGLVANVYLWSIGQPTWIRMAIQAMTAFYLNSAPIRELFERRSEVEPIVLRDPELESS